MGFPTGSRWRCHRITDCFVCTPGGFGSCLVLFPINVFPNASLSGRSKPVLPRFLTCFFPWHGSCVSEGQIDFILDVFFMFCPSHQLLVNKFVTDFGRSKRPPPLHQVVSKPSGGTLATTVTAAREWSMGVRPGVETGQMRSPPKKNTEKSCGEKYLFLPPQKIRSWFKLVEVWSMTLQMCFCWGLIWHLEWCWRRQPFLHSLRKTNSASLPLT